MPDCDNDPASVGNKTHIIFCMLRSLTLKGANLCNRWLNTMFML